MKGFIEVTEFGERIKILINISIIRVVYQDSGYTYIATENFGSKRCSGYTVVETYEEVKQKIKDFS